ncbi:RNA polymerase factor sigma-54 [Clostridium tepidiprofundi]|nr:RNA polymerase factor sigma-54 [Clostridium tepidiprofundi]
MEFGLHLTQQQKLVMTQQMQLSVKILQMSAYELNQYIDKEILENPVIDFQCNESNKEAFDYKNLIKYFEYNRNTYVNENNGEEKISPFNFITLKKTLKESLKEQLLYLNTDENMKKICVYVIESLDERGYLGSTVDEIASELGVSVQKTEKAISIVQGFEPCGVAARDIKECLKIQLKNKGIIDDKIYFIVDNCLEYLANNKYAQMAKKLNITTKKAQEYGDIIKSLEPKPSRGFYNGEETKYIVPDAYINKIGDEYYIIMNDDIIPKLNINSKYKQIINSSKTEYDDEIVDYVKNKINSAIFLIKSIEHRKNTLYTVLQEIIKIQKDYFDYGSSYLKPMTLKDISDAIGIHESTVSRAIKDKYIRTNNTTIKIKDLFTAGIYSRNGGESISRTSVKGMIEDIINKEDKRKPLSDEKISRILKEKNMNISRRTVTKYREELGIVSSSKRRRY